MSEIPVNLIDPNPFQTRQDFNMEKIIELAESIKKIGLLQKVLVRPHPEAEGRYQLAHGDRRLRAFKHLKKKTIPADVRELTDKDLAEIMIVENIQRADLNPIEEAQSYQTLLEQFGYSKAELGRKIGKSRSYISNSIRLLKMPFFLKACVLCKTLSVWHARTIMGLPDGYAKYTMADLVIDWNLSVAETRDCVNQIKTEKLWIQWEREVPIAGLRSEKKLREIVPGMSSFEKAALLESMKETGQFVPIMVDVVGQIIDGNHRTQCAKQLDWETIRANIIYFTRWLKRRDGPPWAIGTLEGLESNPEAPSINPEPSPEQKKNIQKLSLMLTKTLQMVTAEIKAEEGSP